MSDPSPKYIVVFVTTKDIEEASSIGQRLLEKRLVACANIVNPVQSLFWWEGKIDQGQEALMILKTQYSQFEEVTKEVKAAHSYSVPEILALPVLDGQKDYLKWVDDSIVKDGEMKG